MPLPPSGPARLLSRSIRLLSTKGYGVVQDYAAATAWYRKAAEQGYASAQYNLAILYHKGLGVVQDYAAAIEWFLKAAEQRHESAQAFLLRQVSQLLPDPINLNLVPAAALAA